MGLKSIFLLFVILYCYKLPLSDSKTTVAPAASSTTIKSTAGIKRNVSVIKTTTPRKSDTTVDRMAPLNSATNPDTVFGELDGDELRSLHSNFHVKDLCITRNNTIKAYAVVPLRVTWFVAYVFCKQNRMNLVTIHSREDAEDVKKELKQENLRITDFWIAATRYGSQSEISDFVWFTDGTPLIWSNWFQATLKNDTTQPDNQNNIENCVCLSAYQQKIPFNYAWHDTNCDKQKSFICESACDTLF